MKTRIWTSVFLVGGAVSGCAHHPPKLPAAQTATFDGVKAEYVDVTRLPNPCDVDGKQIAAQIESENGLLSHFLEKTGGSAETWTQADIDEARRAKEVVTPVVDAEDNTIQALSSKCPYLDPALRLQDAQKRGRDLVTDARQRLRELPGQLDAQQHTLDVAAWKQKQGAAITQAHDTWCPPKPRPGKMPDIYYAAQDETGRTAWLFCDGAKVLTSEGGAPQFIPPPGRHHPAERNYLSSANNFPPDEIKHAPPLKGHADVVPDNVPKPPDPTLPQKQ